MDAQKIIAQILNAKKIVAYFLGIVAQVVATGLVPAPFDKYAYGVLAVATAVGIYKATNEEVDTVGAHGNE